ncbi:hypothetical protein Tco_0424951 [Tanacetum coccineum]
MTTLAEFMILYGVDNRPPMLDKDLIKKYEEFSATRRFKLIVISRQLISFFMDYHLMSIHSLIITELSMIYGKVNTKFLNSLPPEWSKFVTDVKLVKDLHTTNFDQLNAYLEQHEFHANEVLNQQTHLAEFPHMDSGLAVHVLKQGDDPIDAINKMMSFLSTQVSSKVLNEEELEFLADPGVAEAKAVFMANLSSYRSDVLSEYLLETQNAAVQDTNSSAQHDAMILSVFEQLSNQVTNYNKVYKDNLIANESLSVELERYKERVKLLEERKNVDLRTREKISNDYIIREKNAQLRI